MVTLIKQLLKMKKKKKKIQSHESSLDIPMLKNVAFPCKLHIYQPVLKCIKVKPPTPETAEIHV